MVQEIFKRYEYKYVINRETYEKILQDLEDYFTLDKDAKKRNKNSIYTISNIYYDTEDELFNSELMREQPFKQKLRLRVYDEVSLEDSIFLEIKKKYKGVVYKRRTGIKLKDAYNLLESNNIDLSKVCCTNNQILKEIYFLYEFYHLTPRTIISYDRQAFQGICDENLRLTFDMNLRCRVKDLKIENGSYGYNFVPEDTIVMEIKARNTVPMWLPKILEKHKCYKGRFSKYFDSKEFRKKLLNNELCMI